MFKAAHIIYSLFFLTIKTSKGPEIDNNNVIGRNESRCMVLPKKLTPEKLLYFSVYIRLFTLLILLWIQQLFTLDYATRYALCYLRSTIILGFLTMGTNL